MGARVARHELVFGRPARSQANGPRRYLIPAADMYETDDALAGVLEMLGVAKRDLEVALENGWTAASVSRSPYRRDRPGEDRRQGRG